MLLYLAALEYDSDRALFLKLQEAYESKMYHAAFSILKSQALAEDALQDSWMNIIRSFEAVKVRPRDEIEGYLVTVVTNAARDIFRKETHTDPLPGDWEGPDPRAEEATGYRALVEIIRSMPEQYREILELKFVQEWSNKEIAARLHMNESTVASRVERGRALLKKVLREEGACYE